MIKSSPGWNQLPSRISGCEILISQPTINNEISYTPQTLNSTFFVQQTSSLKDTKNLQSCRALPSLRKLMRLFFATFVSRRSSVIGALGNTFFYNRPPALSLSPSSADSNVELEHVQDSCNKSTAIYTTNPSPEPHSTARIQEAAVRVDIIDALYERWFDSHNVDIDFGNFFAKVISFRPPSNQQATIKDIINFRRVWCDHIEFTLPSCATSTDLLGLAIQDRPYYPDHGPMGINSDQNTHYKLRPLFRALLLIADNNAKRNGIERVVQVIQTNLAELSAPIDLSTIEPKIEHDSRDGRVTTTLSAAYDFVVALELREQAAYPGKYRDPKVAEEVTGLGSHTERAKFRGYSGLAIQGPSSCWVHLSEDEDVVPPVTPLVLSTRCHQGLPPPRMPWARKSTPVKS